METPRPVTAGPAEFPRSSQASLSLPSFLYGNPWFRVTPSFFRLRPLFIRLPNTPIPPKGGTPTCDTPRLVYLPENLFLMLARERARSACDGPRLSPTARLRAQEYRLRLKRFPPIRQVGRFPPFKSSTAFRALAPPPLCAVLKRQLTFPFSKEKLRLELTFSLQNGIQKIPGEKGKNKGERPNRNGDGHLTKQLTINHILL